MIKYTTAQVTFREIPDEITLCINISNCPIHCPDCHSKELWENVGEELTQEKLWSLIEKNKGITCICIMGGDGDYESLGNLISSMHYYNSKHPFNYIKIAFYSGRKTLSDLFSKLDTDIIETLETLDYIKVGNYISSLGGLDKPTTNQRLYDLNGDQSNCLYTDSFFELYGDDITYKFWKNDTDIKKTRMEAKR